SGAGPRPSADVWPRGSFSATLVSVFVCLRGGNAFASLAALRAGCATVASVSCCGAGLCLLTAAAAAGGVGLGRRASAGSLGGGLAWTAGAGAGRGGGEDERSPPRCASAEALIAVARPAALTSTNFTRKREKQEFSPDMETPLRRNRAEFQRPSQGEFRARAARKGDDTTEKVSPSKE